MKKLIVLIIGFLSSLHVQAMSCKDVFSSNLKLERNGGMTGEEITNSLKIQIGSVFSLKQDIVIPKGSRGSLPVTLVKVNDAGNAIATRIVSFNLFLEPADQEINLTKGSPLIFEGISIGALFKSQDALVNSDPSRLASAWLTFSDGRNTYRLWIEPESDEFGHKIVSVASMHEVIELLFNQKNKFNKKTI